jgi:paraquat-inducible protein B
VGSPVYYRSIQVGQVVGYDLDEDGRMVSVEIFVASPDDRLVFTNTRFWNASGLDFKLTAEGIQVDTQSLLSVVIGGVAFDTPDTLDEEGGPAPAGQSFPLYGSRDEAHERIYLERNRYLMHFDGSARGLNVGAPVLVRGIKVGEVLDVQLRFEVEKLKFDIPVLIELQPERISVSGDREELDGEDVLARLVEKGLRGQLKSGNLLTGQLLVDLDLHPDAPPATIETRDGFRVIPTVAAPLDAIAIKANRFLDTLQGLPLEEIANDLRDTIAGAKSIANSKELMSAVTELESVLKQIGETASGIDRDVTPELNAALRQARSTLKAAEGVVSEDSVLYTELKRLVRELSAAARSIRGVADYLERHPEALLKGKGNLQ